MDWIKQLPTWVKGTIAFLSAVIGFITLFLKNVYLSLTVSVVTALVAAFAFCVYLAFSKEQSTTPGGRSAYRFPQYRRLGLSGLLVVPLLSATLIAVGQTRNVAVMAFVGTATPISTATTVFTPVAPIELVSQDYQKDSMLYDLIVQNNSETPQVLNKVGVVSNITDGHFGCADSGSPLISAGHYIVRYYVSMPETAQKMEPPLRIPPNDVVRFTVSLLPDDASACENWTSEITLFIENVNGVRVQAQPQTIGRSDVSALQFANTSGEELMNIARSSGDAISKAQAIYDLSGNTSNAANPLATPWFASLSADEKAARYAVFSETLQDPSPDVRHSAVVALASLENTDAVPQLISVLHNDSDVDVRTAAAEALGQLADPRADEPLGSALRNDSEYRVQSSAALALGAIGDRNAESYLIAAWNDKSTSNLVDGIATSLVELQSTQAIPLLTAKLQSPGDDEDRLVIVRALVHAEPSYLSPFVPTLIDLLARDPSESFRGSVAFNFRLAPDEPRLIPALGKCAMEDASSDVRMTAVASLSQIGTSAAIKELRSIVASQTGEVKKAAQDALKTLGQVP